MSDKKTQLESLLVGAAEAASLLGIGRSLFYQMHSSSRLGPLPVKLGSRSLWSRVELRLWVDKNCPGRAQWQQILKDTNGH